MPMRLPVSLLALLVAVPSSAQVTSADDALGRVRDSRAARAADRVERTEAVHDLLRPGGSVEPSVRSGSLLERQLRVERSLLPPAGQETSRSPRPVEVIPIETLLIPQGKPFGRTPPR